MTLFQHLGALGVVVPMLSHTMLRQGVQSLKKNDSPKVSLSLSASLSLSPRLP